MVTVNMTPGPGIGTLVFGVAYVVAVGGRLHVGKSSGHSRVASRDDPSAKHERD
jgi:hypothetical protein